MRKDMPLEKFRRWLNGDFTCSECGNRFHTMFFGFGKAICPNCHSGGRSFLFFDESYWLNRVMAKLFHKSQSGSESLRSSRASKSSNL